MSSLFPRSDLYFGAHSHRSFRSCIFPQYMQAFFIFFSVTAKPPLLERLSCIIRKYICPFSYQWCGTADVNRDTSCTRKYHIPHKSAGTVKPGKMKRKRGCQIIKERRQHMKTVAERRRQGSRSAPESRLPVFRLLS